MKSRKMLGNAILLFTAMIWGTAFVFQKTGMEHIGPITFCATRMYLAAAALALLCFVFDKIKAKNGTLPSKTMSPEAFAKYKKDTLIGGICCGCCLTCGSLFQQMGVVGTDAGKSGFITALYMLLVPVISFVFLRRKVTWLAWIGVAVGTFGLYLLSIKSGFSIEKTDGLLMICAMFFALHILCCDHFVDKGDALRISMLQFMTTAVIATILAFIFETPAWADVKAAAGSICYCGFISAGMGYTLQIIGQKYAEPTAASLLMSLESVFAAIAGAIILHEVMSTRELMGCIIMFAAIVLVQLPVPERKKT